MQIALLHFAAPPIIGGVERVIYYHAKELAKAGHSVRVIAGRGEVFDTRVSIHRVEQLDSRHPEVLALKAELDQGYVPAAFGEMRDRIVRDLRPLLDGVDVLIAHNILGLHKNLPLTAALRRLAEETTGPHLIAWHHDLSWKAAHYLPDMHDGYPWDLLRQPWPRTRHVAVSDARRREVAELFGVVEEAIAVVPGGVDVLSFLAIDDRSRRYLEQTSLLVMQPWLLLPARITRRKNIELAIQATAQLRQWYPHIALIVTGPPGPHNPENATYYDELRALRDRLSLSGQIIFLAEALGDAPDDALMAALYRLSDALILPSYEEGFGLPVLEAGLARLPIFCADIPALRELAGSEATRFSPKIRPDTLARLIHEKLSNDPTARLRRRVLDCFDWEQVVQRHLIPLLESHE